MGLRYSRRCKKYVLMKEQNSSFLFKAKHGGAAKSGQIIEKKDFDMIFEVSNSASFDPFCRVEFKASATSALLSLSSRQGELNS